MHNVAKEIVMTDAYLGIFSVFVSVALKHLTRSDGINHYATMKTCNTSVYQYSFLVIWHANCLFYIHHYIVMCALCDCTIFFQTI